MLNFNISEDKNLQRLLYDINNKPLALFVGAGINVPMIPTWDGLLNEILEMSIRTNTQIKPSNTEGYKNLISWLKSDKLSVYEKASYIKTISEKRYIYFLEDVLYKNAANPKPSSTFLSVADLCGCIKVRYVVSYNYDDFLLTEVKKQRKAYSFLDKTGAYQPGARGSANSAAGDCMPELPFYFVHGYIPRRTNYINHRNKDIVLSYDEYFLNMLNPYSWQTVTQIYFLRNYTCLFLGTSLSDWNMLRLIQYACDGSNSIYMLISEQSFYKEGEPYASSDYVKTNIIGTRAAILNNFGVKLILTGSTYDTIGDTVNYIKENIK